MPLAGITRTDTVHINPADWNGSFQIGINANYFGISRRSQNVALEFLPNIVIARVYLFQGYESAHPLASLNYANGGQILKYRLMSIIHLSGGHFKAYTDHQDAQYMVYDGLKPTNCKGVATLKPGNRSW